MLFSLWALLLTMWMLRPQQVSSFNLDTQNVMKKSGEADTLFGFSMAMHHQLKPSEERVLLIGAPRAKALPNQNANISGGLYRCKFTQSNDCERIKVDIKEKQWLGVRVRSQGRGGKVVTCAHRYQDWSFDNQRLLGRCFVLEQDLTLVKDGESTRTICKNREPDKHNFGYCQQGVSVAFSKDNRYLVYGAPGAYDWKGIVHMEPVDNFFIETFETGDHNQRQHKLIPVDISSFLGFVVDTGMNLMKKGELNVVAGAPRSNHSGEVLLLRMEEKAEIRNLKAEYILQGPGLASSFGYDLTILDINSDGWDDLVVGAPEFSKKNMDEDVGGAVYVYINQAKGQRWNQIKPVCLYGKRDSMFGLAVAHIGDIDQDGYQDFAVSAPNEDTGRGRVYIYHGSAAGFHKKPEVLDSGHPGIKSFGYSLAGNMDIDDNGYPDLAVGSLSDTVQVYRSKPVVNIEKTLTLTPNAIDFKAQDLNCKNLPFHFDNICQSNLQLQYSFCTKDQQGDKCDPLAMENDIPVISPGDENIALEVTVTNIGGDDAHQSQLSVTFPEFLRLSSVELKKSSETQVQCNPNENKTQANCQLGNPFKRDSEVSFFLILSTERLSLSVKSTNVTMISIQDIPVVVAEAKIVFKILAKPSQLFFGGKVKDEKAMKSEDDIGSLVQYEFRIINLGRPLKSFGSVVLNIQWPKATKDGKRLLYLVQIKDQGTNIIHCTPSEAINPLRFIKVVLKFVILANVFLPLMLPPQTCADDLRCVDIKCPLEAVNSTTAVVLHARLWNNTFLEEYSSLNYLDIVLDAFLTLNGTQENIGMQQSDVKLTVFRERKPALLSRVPWWVILFSIMTALLLMALLFYLLWKVM
uniref:Integrin, alpha 6, like n=1 Tax=Cyprinus carpio TaxID=7962 RepID=A0A8C2H5M8_CYPCA